mgnify:FL=1
MKEVLFKQPTVSKNKRLGNASFRVDLLVPYSDKDFVKRLGARWDGDKKTWYVFLDQNRSIKPFTRWLRSPIIE